MLIIDFSFYASVSIEILKSVKSQQMTWFGRPHDVPARRVRVDNGHICKVKMKTIVELDDFEQVDETSNFENLTHAFLCFDYPNIATLGCKLFRCRQEDTQTRT